MLVAVLLPLTLGELEEDALTVLVCVTRGNSAHHQRHSSQRDDHNTNDFVRRCWTSPGWNNRVHISDKTGMTLQISSGCSAKG